MPTRPPRHEAPVGQGRAVVRQQYDADRGSASARGYDATWRRLRIMHLNREPLCRFCFDKGLLVEALDVDHIQPIEEAPERRLDPTNLRSLCRPCHSRHTREAT